MRECYRIALQQTMSDQPGQLLALLAHTLGEAELLPKGPDTDTCTDTDTDTHIINADLQGENALVL